MSWKRLICILLWFDHDLSTRSRHVRGREPGTGRWEYQCNRCGDWIPGPWK